MSGQGFARRITLENLGLFSPLLGSTRSKSAVDESSAKESDATKTKGDPALEAAERLFAGAPFKTGMKFSGGRRISENKGPKMAQVPGRVPAGPQELLMRVLPRRNGKQLQMSLQVHRSKFMREASHVISASSGAKRGIGFDRVNRGSEKVINLARFEAPEMAGMKIPVARFRWIKNGLPGDEELEYEILDAATDTEGAEILAFLEAGITTPPSTKLDELGETETVLSKGARRSAQWYRLSSIQ